MHVHDLMAFALQTFNVTHTINSFSFGERVEVTSCTRARFSLLRRVAGGVTACCGVLLQTDLVNPLDAHRKVLYPEQGNGMYQYYIKVSLQRRSLPPSSCNNRCLRHHATHTDSRADPRRYSRCHVMHFLSLPHPLAHRATHSLTHSPTHLLTRRRRCP
jgi:hypothetical protein